MIKLDKIRESAFNGIEVKMYAMNEIARFCKSLSDLDADLFSEYKVTGQEQATKWVDGELVPQWDDEDQTIPHMRDKWEKVPKETLEGEEIYKHDAYMGLIKLLNNIF